jgi:hypothetical protein
LRGGGPAGILSLPAAQPDPESWPLRRIIRAAETPMETIGEKPRGDPGSPLSLYHAGKVPVMSDTETVDPLLPRHSPNSRNCRSEGGGKVAHDAAGHIPRGFRDVIRSFFCYNKHVLGTVSPSATVRLVFDPWKEAASCRFGKTIRAGSFRGRETRSFRWMN